MKNEINTLWPETTWNESEPGTSVCKTGVPATSL